MRKIIGFDWGCTEDMLIHRRLRAMPSKACEPIAIVEDTCPDSSDDPFKMKCRQYDLDGNEVGICLLYFCRRPGFLFDDGTYLCFNINDTGMSKGDFNRYVHEQVIKHMNNDDIPEICNMEDIIF